MKLLTAASWFSSKHMVMCVSAARAEYITHTSQHNRNDTSSNSNSLTGLVLHVKCACVPLYYWGTLGVNSILQ